MHRVAVEESDFESEVDILINNINSLAISDLIKYSISTLHFSFKGLWRLVFEARSTIFPCRSNWVGLQCSTCSPHKGLKLMKH